MCILFMKQFDLTGLNRMQSEFQSNLIPSDVICFLSLNLETIWSDSIRSTINLVLKQSNPIRDPIRSILMISSNPIRPIQYDPVHGICRRRRRHRRQRWRRLAPVSAGRMTPSNDSEPTAWVDGRWLGPSVNRQQYYLIHFHLIFLHNMIYEVV